MLPFHPSLVIPCSVRKTMDEPPLVVPIETSARAGAGKQEQSAHREVPTSVQKMQKGGKEEAKRGIALFTAPLSLPDATQAQITNRTV
jgi:hypothetical protein